MDFSLDSKLVVDFVNSNNSSNTNFRSIISRCRQLLSRFTNSKAGFCWNKGCFTSHLLSFDNNKVLKIINWIC